MEKKKFIKEIEKRMIEIAGICKLNDIDYLSLAYIHGAIQFNSDPNNKKYYDHFLDERQVDKKLRGHYGN